jgi:hypothetical protein
MPLLWVSLFFISGILVGSLLSLPAAFWLTLTIAMDDVVKKRYDYRRRYEEWLKLK